jgi:hypothetical protein
VFNLMMNSVQKDESCAARKNNLHRQSEHGLLQSVLYHLMAFALYLSASAVLVVSISREDVKGYRDGLYYEPFMAAGVRTLTAATACAMPRAWTSPNPFMAFP